MALSTLAKRAGEFGAPSMTDEQDQAKVLKTSQRVAASMVKYALCDEAVEVDPDEIGADMMNRGGAIPNILVCRENICESFKKDGFDKNKPMPGILKDYSRQQAKRQALILHNQSFTEGDARWPPVIVDKMAKGSLAGTHLTIAIRIHKHRVMSIAGEAFDVGDDANLARVTTRGHKYWILDCEIPDKDAVEISEWRNSDNNNNQVKHEVEHLRGLQRISRAEMDAAGAAGVVSLSQVLAKFSAQSQLKIAQQATLDLARCVIDFGSGHYVDRICTFHSQHINPNELSVPAHVYGAVAKHLQASELNSPAHV